MNLKKLKPSPRLEAFSHTYQRDINIPKIRELNDY